MRTQLVPSSVVLDLVGVARTRQARREANGDPNYGSISAGAADHALGLLGEWIVVVTYYPERVAEWRSNADLDMAEDNDVLGLIYVRTRDRFAYEGWINTRAPARELDSWHALVTAQGVKARLLDADPPEVYLTLHGLVWGRSVATPDYFQSANGHFPNRDSWVIPHSAYREAA